MVREPSIFIVGSNQAPILSISCQVFLAGGEDREAHKSNFLLKASSRTFALHARDTSPRASP
ncbi:hypothetical protein PSP6_770006 [Paraburkholderia tropica]|nr:hypothetical protein PSP6_770006 [Paraburkholderia tropica]